MKSLESIKKQNQVIRFDDLSPLTPVYLGESKVSFNEGYVVESNTLKKHRIKITGEPTPQVWATPEPKYLTLNEGGDSVVVIVTHTSKPETLKTEALQILEVDIKSSTEQQAEEAGDPNYLDTHTVITVCNVAINDGTATFTDKLSSNIYVLFYGEKEEE